MDIFTPTVPHVYTAIAEVTAELAKVGIGKDRTADMGGKARYKFRGIDDVYNALSGLLAKSKLCLIPRVINRSVSERVTTKSDGRGGTYDSVLFYVVLDVDYDLVSAVDGSSHTAHVVGEAMDSGDKATNKAMSAAYKYMAMQLFCIPTEGDNDADATVHEGIKPGIGVHSPLGEVTVTPEVEAYTNALKTASDPVVVTQICADLKNEGEETYRAVWSLLDSKTRSGIKKVLAQKEAA